MKMNFAITTLAIKFDDGDGRYHYSIDTYARLYYVSNKAFIARFMSEYAGNGIESITILQNDEIEMYVDTFRELESIAGKLREKYSDLNWTILDY